MALVHLRPVPAEVVEALRAVPGILDAKAIELD